MNARRIGELVVSKRFCSLARALQSMSFQVRDSGLEGDSCVISKPSWEVLMDVADTKMMTDNMVRDEKMPAQLWFLFVDTLEIALVGE